MRNQRSERSTKYEIAKTSLIYQTKEFFDQSTLHGVRYIAEEGRPFIDRFLWIFCTSVGAIVTLIIISSLWEKFQTNPTITGLDTDFHNWDVEFPGITFCQENPVDEKLVDELIAKNFSKIEPRSKLKEYLTELGRISPHRLPNFVNFTKFPTFPQNNLRELAMQVINRCETIMDETCVWKSEEVDCCSFFHPTLTENGFCYSFNVLPSQGLFQFHTEKLPEVTMEYIYETDPKWSIEFSINDADTNPVEMFLHPSNDQPGVDLEAQHVWDKRIFIIAFSAKTTYTTEDAQQLSVKQRRCVFPQEIKLLTSETYTYGACMRECRMKAIYEKCQCVPFYYKTVGKYIHCDFTGLICLDKYKDLLTSKMHCTCDLSCFNTVYEVEKLGESNVQDGMYDTKTLEITFVSWPMIRYKREVLFGWVDLLVSFGGIAGLFLGFSLLSGVEIIYYLTMRTCCMAMREQDKLEKLAKEYKMKEKRDLDLSLTPYFMRPKEQERPRFTTNSHLREVKPF